MWLQLGMALWLRRLNQILERDVRRTAYPHRRLPTLAPLPVLKLPMRLQLIPVALLARNNGHLLIAIKQDTRARECDHDHHHDHDHDHDHDMTTTTTNPITYHTHTMP